MSTAKTILGTALVSLGLLGVLAGLATTAQQKAKEPPTELYIDTVPAGAKITIADGEQLGISPGLFKIDPGVRRIVVELDGHDPQGKDVTIRTGEITRVKLKLRKRSQARAGSSPPRWSKAASASQAAERILRTYAEAVWDELLPRLKRADPKEASAMAARVASVIAARHVLPQKDLVARYILGQLPKAASIDRSQWTPVLCKSQFAAAPPEVQQGFWHPVSVARTYCRLAVREKLGLELLAKRSLLEACAPVPSVVLDASLDHPEIATAYGDELIVVRLERNREGVYRCREVEWLKQKPGATQSYSLLAPDATPAQKVLRKYGDAAWARLLPRLESMQMNQILEEARRLAESHLSPKRDVLIIEARRILANLPEADPVNRPQWRQRFPESTETGGSGAEKDIPPKRLARDVSKPLLLKKLTEDMSKGGPLPLRWNPLYVTRWVRMTVLAATETPESLGLRAMIEAIALYPLDAEADADPDHPVIVTRTGNEMSIVLLRRNAAGLYDLEDFEWLIRANDSAEVAGIHPLPPRDAGVAASKERPRHFVRLVVGKDTMTFEGQKTEWGTIAPLLGTVSDRPRTVLEIAKARGELSMNQWAKRWSDDFCRASTLARFFKFEYVDDVGPQPPGSKGSPTQTVVENEARPPKYPIMVHLCPPGGPLPVGAGWVHDLATGETLGPSSDPMVMDFADCNRLGKGDLACYSPDTFSCLRGAEAIVPEIITNRRVVRSLSVKRKRSADNLITYQMPELPCFLLVTTAENRHFEVTLYSVSQDGGLNFDYKPADSAVVRDAEGTETSRTRRVLLPQAAGRGEHSVLDLASGATLACSEEADHDPGVFTRLGKGDLLFHDEAVACLRGAKAMQWEGNRFFPLPIKEREKDGTAYKLPELPCRLLITTAEKKHFDVTVLPVTPGTKERQFLLEYRPADPAALPKGAADGGAATAAQSDPAFRALLRGKQALDLDTGQLASWIAEPPASCELAWESGLGRQILCMAHETVPPPLNVRSFREAIAAAEERLDELEKRGQSRATVIIVSYYLVPTDKGRLAIVELGEMKRDGETDARVVCWSLFEIGKDSAGSPKLTPVRQLSPQTTGAEPPQPAAQPINRVLLPEARGRGEQSVLDLASGQTLPCSEEAARDFGVFTRMGKGDLLYEDVLYCLRGAQAECLERVPFPAGKVDEHRKDVTSYKLPRVPCRLRITTAEKKQFDVTIVAVTEHNGIDVEYRPADASAPQSAAVQPPAAAVTGETYLPGDKGRVYPSAEQRDAVTALEQLGALVMRDADGRAKTVDLKGTQATNAELVHLKGLASLQSLDLFGMNISDAGLVHLTGLTELEMLQLGGTPVTDAGLRNLKGLTKLKTLNLYDTKVTDAGLEHLKGLTKLETLTLPSNLTNAGLVHLRGLTELSSLSLSFTQVTDAGLVQLKGLNQLKDLGLRSTKVSDAGLVHLKDLPQLERLRLNNTQATVEGVKQLKQARPKLQIFRDEYAGPDQPGFDGAQAATGVEEVQVRLRADKHVWQAGEIPTFQVDVRNGAESKLYDTFGRRVIHLLGFDDRWYRNSDSVRKRQLEIPPGGQWGGLGISLRPEDWHREGTPNTPQLTPGKHVVWVAFVGTLGAGSERDGGKPVRAVGNPVEIEIRPASATNQPDNHQESAQPAEMEVRKVVESFLAAAMAGRNEEAIRMTDPASAVGHQLEDVRTMGGPGAMKLAQVGLKDNTALAVTTQVKDDRDREGVLLIRLINSRGQWVVQDIDFTSAAEATSKLEAISNPSQIETVRAKPAAEAEKTTWGKAVEGVQCRLRADRSVWRPGDVPTFKAEIRNRGTRSLRVAASQEGCELVLDGKTHHWPGFQFVEALPLHPGSGYDVRISLIETWFGGGPATLTPGEHKLSVRFQCLGVGNQSEKLVALVESNTVEFEIRPAGETQPDHREKNPPPEMEARKVVESFLASAIAGRNEEALRMTDPAGVDVIVSKWAITYSAADAQFVDVTDLIVEPFKPNERTKRFIRSIRDKPPLPLEEIEKHRHDH